ncbi:hypothetical protein [Zavarzinia sp. CC-PAN008]|uniref:hypothetical protein n=1 Tax=Zavarzinia sp. CC-PAN008 TaxID=3243332 RepID=UPI003F744520
MTTTIGQPPPALTDLSCPRCAATGFRVEGAHWLCDYCGCRFGVIGGADPQALRQDLAEAELERPALEAALRRAGIALRRQSRRIGLRGTLIVLVQTAAASVVLAFIIAINTVTEPGGTEPLGMGVALTMLGLLPLVLFLALKQVRLWRNGPLDDQALEQRLLQARADLARLDGRIATCRRHLTELGIRG